jgi:hypothetical protein
VLSHLSKTKNESIIHKVNENFHNHFPQQNFLINEFEKLKLNYEKLLLEYKEMKMNLPKNENIERESMTNIKNQVFVTEFSAPKSATTKVIESKVSEGLDRKGSLNLKLLNNEKPKIILNPNLNPKNNKSRSKSNKIRLI